MQNKEKVLVVKRKIIFKKEKWQGLKTENLDYYLKLIKSNFCFKERNKVENNPFWQQIIPYIIFSFKNKFFIYRYLKKASEKRLLKDYMLGIGGHINEIDLNKKRDIFAEAANREWREEIDYQGKIIEKKLVGILNDEKRKVEAVHLGLIYHFIGNSPKIFVKEKEILAGKLLSLREIKNKILRTNGWAKIIFNEYLSNFLK